MLRHLFPTVQSDMANKLNQEREELINVGEEHGQEKPLEKRDGSIQDVEGRKRGTGNESETDGF